MRRFVTSYASTLAAAVLSGCAAVFPRVDVADTKPPLPEAMPQEAPRNGSLFSGGTYRPLFEDYRARLVGDTLTVNIAEKVSATAKSTSSLDKSGSLTASIAAIPGVSPNALRRGTGTASDASAFSGKGSTENSNEFTGTITVVVRGVLPNGVLLVAGEKQIGVNENVDVLRFSGQVDPRAIQPGNQVASSSIANVRLEQRGRGQQAETQAIGWLGRVFLSLAPF